MEEQNIWKDCYDFDKTCDKLSNIINKHYNNNRYSKNNNRYSRTTIKCKIISKIESCLKNCTCMSPLEIILRNIPCFPVYNKNYIETSYTLLLINEPGLTNMDFLYKEAITDYYNGTSDLSVIITKLYEMFNESMKSWILVKELNNNSHYINGEKYTIVSKKEEVFEHGKFCYWKEKLNKFIHFDLFPYAQAKRNDRNPNNAKEYINRFINEQLNSGKDPNKIKENFLSEFEGLIKEGIYTPVTIYYLLDLISDFINKPGKINKSGKNNSQTNKTICVVGNRIVNSSDNAPLFKLICYYIKKLIGQSGKIDDITVKLIDKFPNFTLSDEQTLYLTTFAIGKINDSDIMKIDKTIKEQIKQLENNNTTSQNGAITTERFEPLQDSCKNG